MYHWECLAEGSSKEKDLSEKRCSVIVVYTLSSSFHNPHVFDRKLYTPKPLVGNMVMAEQF